MKTLVVLVLFGLTLFGIACQSNTAREKADLALLDGTVYTVDPAMPWGEAVAVKGGRIVAVGSSAEIRGLIGPETQVLQLNGDLVLPGFIDAHTHFLSGGFALSAIQLRDAGSREEFIARIQAKAQELDKGRWILNGDWDHTLFDPPQLPDKEWVDGLTPDNPVCVNRLDGHMVFVNSLALKLAGIDRETPTPQGGEIVKDPQTGEPTGILKDEAMGLVTRHIPEPSPEEKRQAARSALEHALAHGVTSIHDMSTRDDFAVYRDLLNDGLLSARLCVYIPISEIEPGVPLDPAESPDTERLKFGGLKGFVDGSLGSFTALFFEPYSDNPDTSGILVADMYPEGIMEKRLRAAERQGLQVAVHAIGDRANREILDIFERVFRDHGRRDRRWRVEHAQHLHPDDIPRFGRLGVLASVQPYHAIDDGRWAEEKIGPQRVKTTYAFRSLLREGVTLVCGSDWTVAPLDPLTGIYAAVTRRTLDGGHPQGWVPQEKIGPADAIRGYTLNGALAEFAEDSKGSITPGKLADLVVLDRNLFEIPPEEILKARVCMTLVGGRVVYTR